MNQTEIKAIIESLLFIWGEPLSINDISDVINVDKKECNALLKEMIDEFNYKSSGTKIIQINDSYQLSTHPEHFDYINKLCTPKTNKGLSTAALETLSIIAYKQPITRADIESIRGVKCDKSINTLIEKNLVTEVGRLDKTGKPILYGTTDFFLKYFGLTIIDELPQIEELKDINFDDE